MGKSRSARNNPSKPPAKKAPWKRVAPRGTPSGFYPPDEAAWWVPADTEAEHFGTPIREYGRTAPDEVADDRGKIEEHVGRGFASVAAGMVAGIVGVALIVVGVQQFRGNGGGGATPPDEVRASGEASFTPPDVREGVEVVQTAGTVEFTFLVPGVGDLIQFVSESSLAAEVRLPEGVVIATTSAGRTEGEVDPETGKLTGTREHRTTEELVEAPPEIADQVAEQLTPSRDLPDEEMTGAVDLDTGDVDATATAPTGNTTDFAAAADADDLRAVADRALGRDEGTGGGDDANVPLGLGLLAGGLLALAGGIRTVARGTVPATPRRSTSPATGDGPAPRALTENDRKVEEVLEEMWRALHQEDLAAAADDAERIFLGNRPGRLDPGIGLGLPPHMQLRPDDPALARTLGELDAAFREFGDWDDKDGPADLVRELQRVLAGWRAETGRSSGPIGPEGFDEVIL